MFFKNLETNRLYLQNISPAHRYFIYVLFTNDDVLRFHYSEDRYTDLNGADVEIAEWNQPEPRNQHNWILVRKADDIAIGTCGFHNWDRDSAFCEISYDMYPDFWGNGYMTEALQTIILFARDEMKVHFIEAGIDQDNEKSIRLIERLGFVYNNLVIDEKQDKKICHDKIFHLRF